MFKNAFYVVATFSFMCIVVALIVGIDPNEYNFINVIDKISRVEFPDVLNIFKDVLSETRGTMDSWELSLPSWLNWLDDLSTPFIWLFHFIKILFTNVIGLVKFLINLIFAILPI